MFFPVRLYSKSTTGSHSRDRDIACAKKKPALSTRTLKSLSGSRTLCYGSSYVRLIGHGPNAVLCHQACMLYARWLICSGGFRFAVAMLFTEAMTTMKRTKLKKVNPRKIRETLGLSQSEFWSRIEVTQSGGSRYENGRAMPGPVRRLLGLVYLKEKL